MAAGPRGIVSVHFTLLFDYSAIFLLVELVSMVLPRNDAGCHHSLNTLYQAPTVSTGSIDTSCLWHVIHISKLTLPPEPYTGTGP